MTVGYFPHARWTSQGLEAALDSSVLDLTSQGEKLFVAQTPETVVWPTGQRILFRGGLRRSD